VDPDAVWDGAWIRSRNGVLDEGRDRRRGRAVLGVNFERPIVINGDFVAQLCESDALFPIDFGEDLF